MDKRDLNLAEAAKRAAERMPSSDGRGAGVSAWSDLVTALEAGLAAEGYRIKRVGEPARAPSAGEYTSRLVSKKTILSTKVGNLDPARQCLHAQSYKLRRLCLRHQFLLRVAFH